MTEEDDSDWRYWFEAGREKLPLDGDDSDERFLRVSGDAYIFEDNTLPDAPLDGLFAFLAVLVIGVAALVGALFFFSLSGAVWVTIAAVFAAWFPLSRWARQELMYSRVVVSTEGVRQFVNPGAGWELSQKSPCRRWVEARVRSEGDRTTGPLLELVHKRSKRRNIPLLLDRWESAQWLQSELDRVASDLNEILRRGRVSER